MATDVVMPQMGESIAEGTIVRWIKKVGDKVDRDEPLFEISTDKVDAEIPSPAAGVVAEIRVKEGETVPVNSVVAVIGAAGEAVAATAAAPQAPAAASAPRPAPAPPAPPARRCRAAAAAGAAPAPQAPAQPRRQGADDDRGADPPAVVAARPQDRQGAPRRHLADHRHGHRGPRHEERHPRVHRIGRRGESRPGAGRAAAGAGDRAAGLQAGRARRSRADVGDAPQDRRAHDRSAGARRRTCTRCSR